MKQTIPNVIFIALVALAAGCSDQASNAATDNQDTQDAGTTDGGCDDEAAEAACRAQDGVPSLCARNEVDCIEVTAGEGDCEETISCQLQTQGCNNTVPDECPAGYVDSLCTPGEGSCIETEPDPNSCIDPVRCECASCVEGIEVETCEGFADCVTVDSCGTDIFCASCPDGVCADDENQVESCDDREYCRQPACPSNDELVFFCTASGADCEDPPECPAGTVSCDTAGGECAEIATCGTVLLCEPT